MSVGLYPHIEEAEKVRIQIQFLSPVQHLNTWLFGSLFFLFFFVVFLDWKLDDEATSHDIANMEDVLSDTRPAFSDYSTDCYTTNGPEGIKIFADPPSADVEYVLEY